eukprot:3843894-Pleurochrysis_carterae.AAC.3
MRSSAAIRCEQMRTTQVARANGNRATARLESGCGRSRTKRLCRPFIDVGLEVSLRPITRDPITN